MTEIGVIPEDWEIVSYDKAFHFLRTASYSRSQIEVNGKTRYIHYGDIHTKWNYFVDLNQVLSTIDDSKVCNYSLIEDGDLIMVDASEDYSGICKSVEVINNKKLPAISGLHTILLRDKGNFFIKSFRGYIHSNKLVKSSMDKYATGLKVYGVSKKNLKLVQIPRPPLPEQTAIATVLSDTDTLIEKLEKLIIKKKAIKQGAMQQLLTGKKRLPGFSGKWEVKKLGEIGETYGGLSGKKKSDFDGGKYPYIPFMNIMSNPVIDLQYFDYVNIRGDEKQNKAIKGDLFFNGSSETPEEVGMCSVLQGDIPSLYLNSFCFGFRLNKDLKTDGLYLSYFFRSPVGRQLIFSLAQGATRYNLSKINFMKLKIPYPNPIEQTAIATILSDMDAEIVSLEKKRDKYIMLKQGMMQQLLTGRIRIYANN